MNYTSLESLKKRKQSNGVNNILLKYPDKVPIIVSAGAGITLSKFKYLVPKSFTVGNFLINLKKSLNIRQEETIFIFLKTPSGGEIILPTSFLIETAYEKYKNNGVLYITLAKENTFGCDHC